MNVVALIIVLLIAIGAFSCKNSPAASDVKTLDNFAAGSEVTTNECGIKIGPSRYAALSNATKERLERRIATNSADLRRVTAGVLAAVPKPLQETFYALEGKIVISADAKSLCAEVELTDSEKRFVSETSSGGDQVEYDSCWRKTDDGLEIVLPEDRARIQHATLRLFAYMYTQYVAKNAKVVAQKKSGEVRTSMKEIVAAFEMQRSKLASAFLADLETSGSASAYRSMVDFDLSDSIAFENFVFAEAVDSYYCSHATHATFAKQFQSTFQLFDKGGDKLTAVRVDLGRAFFQ